MKKQSEFDKFDQTMRELHTIGLGGRAIVRVAR